MVLPGPGPAAPPLFRVRPRPGCLDRLAGLRTPGWDFADLLYKALLILTVALIFIVVLGGWGGVGGREWEAQMAGRLPVAGENLRQARAEMDVSLGF